MLFKFSLPTKIKNPTLDKAVHFVLGVTAGALLVGGVLAIYRSFF